MLLEDLFTSKVRVEMLALFLLDPEGEHYVREITRLVRTEINAVRRELENLEKIGLIRKWPRGNRLYYKTVTTHAWYTPLLDLIAHEFGLGAVILENHRKLGKIKYAFISKGFLMGRVAKDEEVDLVIVGQVLQEILKQYIRKVEKDHGHELNYSVLSEAEFRELKDRKDIFITKLFTMPRVMLIGSEIEMVG